MERTSRLSGVDRIIALTHLALVAVDKSVPLRQFVTAESEVAMRVLTGARGGVQDRYVETFERLFTLETGRGHVSFSLDLPSLAYAVVRLAEGFLYADVVGDRERDIDRAEALIAGLLRGMDTKGRPR